MPKQESQRPTSLINILCALCASSVSSAVKKTEKDGTLLVSVHTVSLMIMAATSLAGQNLRKQIGFDQFQVLTNGPLHGPVDFYPLAPKLAKCCEADGSHSHRGHLFSSQHGQRPAFAMEVISVWIDKGFCGMGICLCNNEEMRCAKVIVYQVPGC